MTLTATGRAVTAAFVGAQSTAGDSRTRTRGCYATEAAMAIFVSARGVTPTRQERTTIGGYRLTAAMQRESIKIGRSQRASLASIRHVAVRVRRWTG